MKTNKAEVNEQTVRGLEERLRQILSVPVSHSDRHRRRRRQVEKGWGEYGERVIGARRQTVQKESNAVRETGRENEGEEMEIELMTPTSKYKNKGTKCSAT
ncbi:hypothetical protein QQF64_007423 [Cirrhinus molitorella]|uniref:Uncharacterized protein n=1 Tax=Cirrhinus molitorella TaxID=172907 RepID=A0ABR3MEP7_9TELE